MFWIITLVIIVVACGFRSAFAVVQVRGESMLPTLCNGDSLLIFKYWPRRLLRKDQIVVFHAPRSRLGHYIKRIKALPGDTIDVNLPSLPLQLSALNLSLKQVEYTNVIPLQHVYLRGDNSIVVAADSMTWGPIPFSSIVGVMILKFNKQRQYLA
jgi:signal peptidase I